MVLLRWCNFAERKGAVRIGASANTILESLGMSSQTIAQLESSGVVGRTEWAPPTQVEGA